MEVGTHRSCLSFYNPGFPFWLLDWVESSTDRQLLTSQLQFLGTSSPGRIFWLGQTRISPRWKNSKTGKLLLFSDFHKQLSDPGVVVTLISVC
jgi:hypothetical protein